MKVRTGFVSNSSSSSFVLAIKKDITTSEKNDIFSKYFKNIIKSISEEGYSDPIPEISEIYNNIFMASEGIDLGDWIVTGGECSSESGFISMLLYESGNIDTAKFKFKMVY
jgi:hypothetical protein